MKRVPLSPPSYIGTGTVHEGTVTLLLRLKGLLELELEIQVSLYIVVQCSTLTALMVW